MAYTITADTAANSLNIYQNGLLVRAIQGSVNCFGMRKPFVVSGATNATPIVITTTTNHGLSDGQRADVSNVGGNTNANGNYFAKYVSDTTFSLYTDSTLANAVAGNAAYTSGGQVNTRQTNQFVEADFIVIAGSDNGNFFYESLKIADITTIGGVATAATIELVEAQILTLASTIGVTVVIAGGGVTLNASTTATGGLSISNQTAQTVDSTAVMAGVVKASAGRLGFISAFNAGATPAYVRIYNKATAADPATDVPIYRGIIPANNSVGGGFIQPIIIGVTCSNGIAFRVTGGVKDTDTAALVANTIYLNIAYS